MGSRCSSRIKRLSLNKNNRSIRKYNRKVLEAGGCKIIPQKERASDLICLVHRETMISIAGGLSSTTAWLEMAT